MNELEKSLYVIKYLDAFKEIEKQKEKLKNKNSLTSTIMMIFMSLELFSYPMLIGFLVNILSGNGFLTIISSFLSFMLFFPLVLSGKWGLAEKLIFFKLLNRIENKKKFEAGIKSEDLVDSINNLEDYTVEELKRKNNYYESLKEEEKSFFIFKGNLKNYIKNLLIKFIVKNNEEEIIKEKEKIMNIAFNDIFNKEEREVIKNEIIKKTEGIKKEKEEFSKCFENLKEVNKLEITKNKAIKNI